MEPEVLRFDEMRRRQRDVRIECLGAEKTITTPLGEDGSIIVLNDVDEVLTVASIRADMDMRSSWKETGIRLPHRRS
jgi:hypothetical protein